MLFQRLYTPAFSTTCEPDGVRAMTSAAWFKIANTADRMMNCGPERKLLTRALSHKEKPSPMR